MVSYERWAVNTVPPDFDKPAGQYMQGEKPEEFNPVKGNLFVDASVAVIFGQKGHPAIGNVDNTPVGNGHPVGVLTQVCSTDSAMLSAGGTMRSFLYLSPDSLSIISAQGALFGLQGPGGAEHKKACKKQCRRICHVYRGFLREYGNRGYFTFFVCKARSEQLR
jgi:hypothetical protein